MKLCKGQLSMPSDECVDCKDYFVCFPIDPEIKKFMKKKTTVDGKGIEEGKP